MIPFHTAIRWDDGSSCRDQAAKEYVCVYVCVCAGLCVCVQVSEGLTDGRFTVVTVRSH